MDDNDFMKAFMGVNLLAVQGIAQTVGAVIAKLYGGMIENGMDPQAAERLIAKAFEVFLNSMANYKPPDND